MKRTFSRGVALAAGVVLLLLNGIMYAWSIYSAPFQESFGWTSAQLGFCFTVTLIFFCLSGIAGSRITAARGVGFSVSLAGIIGCAGFCLCALLAADRLWLLYVAYSVCCGSCTGITYNAVMGSLICRFPDKKGLVSGLMLMAFGSSALVLGSLTAALMSSPIGWRGAYIVTGALLLLFALISAPLLRVPTEAAGGADVSADSEADMPPSRMIMTPFFWMLMVFAVMCCASGSGAIGHSRYIMLEVGAPAAAATLIVGLQSVCNGLGRLIFGALYDRLGLTRSLFLVIILFFCSSILGYVALSAGTRWLATAAVMLCGASYGGIPSLTCPACADRFGRKYYGKNLSIFNMHIIPASFSASLVGAIQTSSGSYSGAFLFFLAFDVVAALAVIAIARTQRNKKESAPESV